MIGAEIAKALWEGHPTPRLHQPEIEDGDAGLRPLRLQTCGTFPTNLKRVDARDLQPFAGKEASEGGEGGVLFVRSRGVERPTKSSGRLVVPADFARALQVAERILGYAVDADLEMEVGAG